MQFSYSFLHMETSDALQSYTEQKVSQQIAKFVTKPIEAAITFSVEKHQHKAHCRVTAGDGFDVKVEHTCGDMYGSVDHMVDKLYTQLQKAKDKIKSHKNEKPSKALSGLEMVDGDEDAVDAEDIIKLENARTAT